MLNKIFFVCPPKNKNVPQNFSQAGNKSDQIVAQTLLKDEQISWNSWKIETYYYGTQLSIF